MQKFLNIFYMSDSSNYSDGEDQVDDGETIMYNDFYFLDYPEKNSIACKIEVDGKKKDIMLEEKDGKILINEWNMGNREWEKIEIEIETIEEEKKRIHDELQKEGRITKQDFDLLLAKAGILGHAKLSKARNKIISRLENEKKNENCTNITPSYSDDPFDNTIYFNLDNDGKKISFRINNENGEEKIQVCYYFSKQLKYQDIEVDNKENLIELIKSAGTEENRSVVGLSENFKNKLFEAVKKKDKEFRKIKNVPGELDNPYPHHDSTTKFNPDNNLFKTNIPLTLNIGEAGSNGSINITINDPKDKSKPLAELVIQDEKLYKKVGEVYVELDQKTALSTYILAQAQAQAQANKSEIALDKFNSRDLYHSGILAKDGLAKEITANGEKTETSTNIEATNFDTSIKDVIDSMNTDKTDDKRRYKHQGTSYITEVKKDNENLEIKESVNINISYTKEQAENDGFEEGNKYIMVKVAIPGETGNININDLISVEITNVDIAEQEAAFDNLSSSLSSSGEGTSSLLQEDSQEEEIKGKFTEVAKGIIGKITGTESFLSLSSNKRSDSIIDSSGNEEDNSPDKSEDRLILDQNYPYTNLTYDNGKFQFEIYSAEEQKTIGVIKENNPYKIIIKKTTNPEEEEEETIEFLIVKDTEELIIKINQNKGKKLYNHLNLKYQEKEQNDSQNIPFTTDHSQNDSQAFSLPEKFSEIIENGLKQFNKKHPENSISVKKETIKEKDRKNLYFNSNKSSDGEVDEHNLQVPIDIKGSYNEDRVAQHNKDNIRTTDTFNITIKNNDGSRELAEFHIENGKIYKKITITTGDNKESVKYIDMGVKEGKLEEICDHLNLCTTRETDQEESNFFTDGEIHENLFNYLNIKLEGIEDLGVFSVSLDKNTPSINEDDIINLKDHQTSLVSSLNKEDVSSGISSFTAIETVKQENTTTENEDKYTIEEGGISLVTTIKVDSGNSVEENLVVEDSIQCKVKKREITTTITAKIPTSLENGEVVIDDNSIIITDNDNLPDEVPTENEKGAQPDSVHSSDGELEHLEKTQEDSLVEKLSKLFKKVFETIFRIKKEKEIIEESEVVQQDNEENIPDAAALVTKKEISDLGENQARLIFDAEKGDYINFKLTKENNKIIKAEFDGLYKDGEKVDTENESFKITDYQEISAIIPIQTHEQGKKGFDMLSAVISAKNNVGKKKKAFKKRKEKIMKYLGEDSTLKKEISSMFEVAEAKIDGSSNETQNTLSKGGGISR